MAEINPPSWQQAGSYSARADRLGVISAFSGYSGFSTDEATPLRVRQGVRPSYQNFQLKVRAAATPNMTVIVSAGICVIENHDLSGYGAYTCVNDADVTLAISAADATRYRRDTVVAALYDAETAGGTSSWALQIVSGPYVTTAGAVTRGTLPANAQILADILVGPAVSSIGSGVITDVRNYAVAAGGIVPLNSTQDMDHPHPGQVRYRMDTDEFRYGKADGSSGIIKPYADLVWTNITMASGFGTRASSPTPQVTVNSHGMFEFRGMWQINSGNLVIDGADHQFATLPSLYIPSVSRVTGMTGGVGISSRLTIGPDGTLKYAIASFNTSNTNWMSLDSVTYSP